VLIRTRSRQGTVALSQHADSTGLFRLLGTQMRTFMLSVISVRIFAQVAVDSYRRREISACCLVRLCDNFAGVDQVLPVTDGLHFPEDTGEGSTTDFI